ncbi:MAG: DNA topoisomerase IB [Sphingobacteriales bacterium]|nr:MAG: DNA topoisomerase IB [Sphingobacteriales bacterium]
MPVQRFSPTRLAQAYHDPEATAALADLCYTDDSTPGIERQKTGATFRYLYRGKTVATADLDRIQSLVIPPAWQNVWICKQPDGHLQATGIDARGRKQYRYHPRWNAIRNSTKFHHLLQFGEALPQIRQQAQQDLSRPGMPREKLLAALLQIMQLTGIRIGNEAYEKIYGSFGLTTLKNKHVTRTGNQLTFEFKGKKGVYQSIRLQSRKLSGIIQKCLEIPGKELFQYLDETGARHTIDSGAVNSYIRSCSGGQFSAKDFRTWQGTLQALKSLQTQGCCEDEKEIKQRLSTMLEAVSGKLGNTQTVCRKYYIHPTIIDLYSNGQLEPYFKSKPKTVEGLEPEEQLLLHILRKSSLPVVLPS